VSTQCLIGAALVPEGVVWQLGELTAARDAGVLLSWWRQSWRLGALTRTGFDSLGGWWVLSPPNRRREHRSSGGKSLAGGLIVSAAVFLLCGAVTSRCFRVAAG